MILVVTSQKAYWKIINRVINNCRAPRIPPLLVNNTFILSCTEEAKFFNDFFSKQCKPINTSSQCESGGIFFIGFTDRKIWQN